jgi:hypothetical protein
MKLELKFGTLTTTEFNVLLGGGGVGWDIWIPTDVSVESVASIFRLEEVAVGFSKMLIPFKLHDVTAQKTAKRKLSKIIGR